MRCRGRDRDERKVEVVACLLSKVNGAAPAHAGEETAATGVEVLCAAYLSILENRSVPIPLEESRHPLFE